MLSRAGAAGGAQFKREKRSRRKREESTGGRSDPWLLSVLDASDGLDLGGLAVGAPAPPVLVVTAVFLTLHDVLLAPVARELVAHEAAGRAEKAARVGDHSRSNMIHRDKLDIWQMLAAFIW